MRRAAYLIILGMLIGSTYNLWELLPNKYLFSVYAGILAVEAMQAFWRYERTTPSSYYFHLIGVVLFAISDNILAFLKFNGIPSDLGRGVIMLTYYGAQYFIMHGSLHQSNLQC